MEEIKLEKMENAYDLKALDKAFDPVSSTNIDEIFEKHGKDEEDT